MLPQPFLENYLQVTKQLYFTNMLWSELYTLRIDYVEVLTQAPQNVTIFEDNLESGD